MDIIEIDVGDWAFVIFCMLLSLARSQFIDFTGRVCAAEDTECLDLASVKGFTCIGTLHISFCILFYFFFIINAFVFKHSHIIVTGYIILLGIIIVAYVSYYYECLLLTSKYVTDPHDYAIFLKGDQETLNESREAMNINNKVTLACGSIVSLLRLKKEVSHINKSYLNTLSLTIHINIRIRDAE
jgi:hypothetical protein